MSCSAIFILDLKGKVIISRNYRGDIDMNVIDKFIPILIDTEEEGVQTPIINHDDVTFIFVKYNNIYG
jgi:AP-1 complex subunit mu